VRQGPLEGLQPGRAAAGGQGPHRGAQRRPLRPTSLAQFRTHTATAHLPVTRPRIRDPPRTIFLPRILKSGYLNFIRSGILYAHTIYYATVTIFSSMSVKCFVLKK
jgi:hypothetical protein